MTAAMQSPLIDPPVTAHAGGASAKASSPRSTTPLRQSEPTRSQKEAHNNVPSAATTALEMGTIPSPFEVLDYQRDILERTILFFDVLRRRANNMLEHETAGLPPLINFKYEMLRD